MANKRACTSCHRSPPEVEFISSSGNFCMECMARLEAKEARQRQAAKERWQWLTWTDDKPEKKDKG